MNNWLIVGKIVNTHGVKGEVRVISSTDFAEERYTEGTELFIRHDKEKEGTPVIVKSHRQHKQFDLLQFEGYTSLNDVEIFKGATLFVAKENIQPLEEHEFYYHEIIGCSVITDEGEELGKIKEIISPGANDVWIVQRKTEGKDILLPYIEDVIKEVDVEEKIVRVHLLEGLVE